MKNQNALDIIYSLLSTIVTAGQSSSLSPGTNLSISSGTSLGITGASLSGITGIAESPTKRHVVGSPSSQQMSSPFIVVKQEFPG